MYDFLWVIESDNDTQLTPGHLESEELGRILHKGGHLPGLQIKNISLWDNFDPHGYRFVILFVSEKDLSNWSPAQRKLLDPETYHDHEDFLYYEDFPPERRGLFWDDTYQLNIDQLVQTLT